MLALFAMLAGSLTKAAPPIDSHARIEDAITLIERGQLAFARVRLEPALIDPRLTPAERSRAYYARGYSFFKAGLFASAALDYHRALEFDPGNTAVLAGVAPLYLDGRGVDPDPTLAIDLLQQAAESGLTDAQLQLGYIYLYGIGVPKNLPDARNWLDTAAAAGSAEAMLHLARSWRGILTDEPDPDQALQWLKRARAAGSTEAMAIAGFMAAKGEFGTPDQQAARAYFAEAAGDGSALAQTTLAHMYVLGTGGDADAARGFELFRQAADQGYPQALEGLAWMYATGTGVDADADQAIAWTTRAAEAGLAESQRKLAYLGLTSGDEEGYRTALHWLGLAAYQGDTQAMNDYAWLLATAKEATQRNGVLAVRLAARAVARDPSPAHLDTLAAAYAEAGRFDRAVATQRQAIEQLAKLATATGTEAADADGMRDRMASFEALKPWRE